MRDLPSGTVTFLFTDIEGSTRLLDELGAEAYAGTLTNHRQIVRDACASCGGVEVDTQGDAFFLAFARAPDALRAAETITEQLAEGPVRLRMGVHTGTPLVTDEGYVGADVHRAARIAAAGHGGQVLVSASTATLVDASLRDLGEHRLKDLSAPVRLYQLGEDEFPSLTSLYRTNLPVPATAFLGREAELREVGSLLGQEQVRLVTLTGPGGTGKTRLALQAAAESADNYPDGVWWVPLAALQDPGLVGPSIAEALQLRDEPGLEIGDRLAAGLTGKRLLLLLDNAEHLLPAIADTVVELLAIEGPLLLVTSRERLQLQGEHLYPVPAMDARDGVDLFVAGARRLDPAFTTTAGVGELCERLEWLPLALELAAARTGLYTPEQLLERLSDRLDLLKAGRDSDPRQQTLRATIDWSYELLTPEEQRVYRALSVFAGGCTLETAERVCETTADTLESLLDKSLLRRREAASSPRYWMLETIREHAGEHLADQGERDSVEAAHAGAYLDLVEHAWQQLTTLGSDDAAWFKQLSDERDNVRVALAHYRDHGDARGFARLCVCLLVHLVPRRRRARRAAVAGSRPMSKALRKSFARRSKTRWPRYICQIGVQ